MDLDLKVINDETNKRNIDNKKDYDKMMNELKQPLKIKSKNKTMKRPVISLRIDPDVLGTFKAICIEAGDIDRSKAIERILYYLCKPTSIETTKAIIQEDPSEYK